jgi:hypothetical protein
MPSEDIKNVFDEVASAPAYSGLVIKNTGVNGNKGKRKYFPSNKQDTYIVNAMTGVKYTCKVGSFESLRLYSVVDTTSSCDNKGFLIKSTDKETETGIPNYLYYDSPQQYMEHRKVQLDTETIKSWKNKVSILFPTTDNSDGLFSIDAYNTLLDERNQQMQINFKERHEVDKQNEYSRTHRADEYRPMYVSNMYLNTNVDNTWHTVAKKR